ncbi:MAG: FmdB family transcriptional regulator [Actinobacteria bacterium]|nr:FmdB family transcriptional regulator [Actinomycetota bacterium]MCB9411845.1 FmdB family transcriptional regulator [Actinomycetota bacterium]
MPTYQYLCRNCEHRFDIVQSIHEDPLSVCPECAGTIRRVLHPVGVTFKGSGFYRTDSREATKKKSSSAKPADTSSGGEAKTATPAADSSGSTPSGGTANETSAAPKKKESAGGN